MATARGSASTIRNTGGSSVKIYYLAWKWETRPRSAHRPSSLYVGHLRFRVKTLGNLRFVITVLHDVIRVSAYANFNVSRVPFLVGPH